MASISYMSYIQPIATYISTYLQTQNAFTKIIRPLITHYTRALMRFRCNGLIQTNLEFATLYYLAKYKNTYTTYTKLQESSLNDGNSKILYT